MEKINKSKIATTFTIANQFRFLQRCRESHHLSVFTKTGVEPSKRFGIIRMPPLISLNWEGSVANDRAFYDVMQRYLIEDSKTRDLPFPISYSFSTLNRNMPQRKQKKPQESQGDNPPHPPRAQSTMPYLPEKLFSSKNSIEIVNPSPKNISIHTGSFANRLTTSLRADAVTIGSNIFFAKGKYNPATPQGLALIIHELTHIKQQQNNTNLQKGELGVSQHALLEKEALANERKVLKYFLGYSYLVNNRYKLPHNLSHANRMTMSNNILPNKILNNPILSYETRYISEIGKLVPLPFFSNLEMKNNANSREHVANQATATKAPLIDMSSTNQLKYAAHPIKESSPQAAIGPTPSPMRITPLLAERTRSLDATPVPSATAPSQAFIPTLPSSTQVTTNPVHDIRRLADQVYDLIEQKIKMQRDKRGFR